MGIVRINRDKRFTILSNNVLQDHDLSLKAKGMIAMMYSLPDDWNFSIRGLRTLCKDGESSISATLKELEINGYLKRTKTKDKNGYFDVIYDIYDTKQSELLKPIGENPCVENPSKENHHNIKETNNKELNNKGINNTNTYNTNELSDEELIDGVSVSVKELNDFFDLFMIKKKSDKRKILKYLYHDMDLEVIKNGLLIPSNRNIQQFDFESDQAPIKDEIAYGMSILEKWFRFNVKSLEDVKKYNRINAGNEEML